MTDRNDLINQIEECLGDGGHPLTAEACYNYLRATDQITYVSTGLLSARGDVDLIKTAAMFVGDNGEIYAIDAATDDMVYRIPGCRHGDGQLDSDDNPVWLLADDNDIGFAREYLPVVDAI